MPGYQEEKEERRFLAFLGLPSKDLCAVKMGSLSEVTWMFLAFVPAIVSSRKRAPSLERKWGLLCSDLEKQVVKKEMLQPSTKQGSLSV